MRLVGWLALVVLLWMGITLLFHFHVKDWTVSGLVGDTFGAVNALFSGLAFAVVIAGLRDAQLQLELQRKQLHDQREDLKLQRELMASSRDQLERQALMQRAQVEGLILWAKAAAVSARIEGMKLFPEPPAEYDGAPVSMRIMAMAAELRENVDRLEAMLPPLDFKDQSGLTPDAQNREP